MVNAGDLEEVLVEVRRVSKVTKGGRRFGFRVIMLVGNGQGNVGCGMGKHAEVLEAKNKALRKARASMVKISLREGRTLHHQLEGKFGASKLFLKPAKEGTGIIAGAAVRKFCEVVGIKDVVGKSYGSSNPNNVIGAMFKLLCNVSQPRYVATKRGKRVSDIVKHREV